MATKEYELNHGVLSRVHDDEPIFVIRGDDPIGPMVVELYASIYEHMNDNVEKVISARAVAEAMRTYEHPEDGGNINDIIHNCFHKRSPIPNITGNWFIKALDKKTNQFTAVNADSDIEVTTKGDDLTQAYQNLREEIELTQPHLDDERK